MPSVISNNKIDKAGIGIYCFGNNNPATLQCNIMSKCYRGIYLNNAAIGNQGSATNPQDNQWIQIGDVDVKGNNNPTEDWYYRSGVAAKFNPTPYDPQSAINPFPLQGNTNNFNCTIGCLMPGPCKQGQLLGSIRNSVNNAQFVNEQRTLITEYVFGELYTNDSLLHMGSPLDIQLTSFYDSVKLTNIAYDASVKTLISNNDTVGATLLNDAFAPSNTHESNHKFVNAAFLKTWAKNQFLLPDDLSSQLSAIAIENPIGAGRAAFVARAMLDTAIIDGLDASARFANQAEPDSMVSIDRTTSCIIYPNPSGGDVVIEYMNFYSNGSIEISDLTGRVMDIISLKNEAGTLQHHLEMNPGVYLWHAMDNDTTITHGKLVIK